VANFDTHLVATMRPPYIPDLKSANQPEATSLSDTRFSPLSSYD